MKVSILEQDSLKTQGNTIPWEYFFLSKLPFTSFNPHAREEHDNFISVEIIQPSNLDLHFFQNSNIVILAEKLNFGKLTLQEEIFNIASVLMSIFNFSKWLRVLKNVPIKLQQQAFIAVCIAYILFLLFAFFLITYSGFHISFAIRGLL